MVRYIVKQEGKKYIVMKEKRELVVDAFPVAILENKERAEELAKNYKKFYKENNVSR